MPTQILLVTPPFTQLNTPYPATAYLTGYFNTQNINSNQLDLGIETILEIFSKNGLEQLFSSTDSSSINENCSRIFDLRASYINTIDAVINFLQNTDSTLAHQICSRNFLPEASKFDQLEDTEWAFGEMGINDRARHLATLYLEDISDYIVDVVDPHFGFSRYAERLSLSANSFDDLYSALAQSSYVTKTMLNLLQEHLKKHNPTLVCFSVPFPGNLYAALKCGQFIKSNFPNIKIAMGGGYPNTELRSLKDTRVFEFVDFITLDDGEAPLQELIKHLNGDLELEQLKRTFTLLNGTVTYLNGSTAKDVPQHLVGTPNYSGLPLKKYLSVIQLTNPMHRLWSDGRWNKLTMAHGCYWGKCTFCDISLDYIKNYEASSAALIVDRVEELINETGERGFHFVDEAAPPALMKAVAIELLKRNVVITWWTNIRFEKSFTHDLCRLLAKSGCIAVSGGLEVASDRLLKLIAKGVTIEQVSKVNNNFNKAGIMVHAYLMYGFPTQTAQETIDSLEVVRQMFEVGILQSAFWHRFAMTAHSPVGIHPEKFNVEAKQSIKGEFANNDLQHTDKKGANHDLFTAGLNKSLYNYMHGVCLDYPLNRWFNFKVPKTKIKPRLIEGYIQESSIKTPTNDKVVIWLGGTVTYDQILFVLKINSNQHSFEVPCAVPVGDWFTAIAKQTEPSNEKTSFLQLRKSFEAQCKTSFDIFWKNETAQALQEIGLIVV